MKKKYAFAGASMRALSMYMKPMINGELNDYCEIVGVYDINAGRAKLVAEEVGTVCFENFEEMVKTTKPDVVLVTTVDVYHSDYIIKALEMGCDVITEKPMTTDADRCNAILEAEKKTGKKVTVTFNYRYAPFMTKIKTLINDGKIGDVFSVQFEWLLSRCVPDRAHGTSYFRRWNSIMEKSGGLLVHKSTHHFDLINWWIGQNPKYVSASGKLNLYGVPGKEKYAGGIEGKYCRVCEHKNECQFYIKLSDSEMKYYADVEDIDGYHKDRCIYSDKVNIYDTMSVNVEYDGGAMLSYALNATTPYEGWRMSINGSEGRLEAYLPENGVESYGDKQIIKIFDMENNVEEYQITKVEGGHGGGDERLRRMLFVGDIPDPLKHSAGTTDGAYSVIIGAAANMSIAEKSMVDVDKILKFPK